MNNQITQIQNIIKGFSEITFTGSEIKKLEDIFNKLNHKQRLIFIEKINNEIEKYKIWKKTHTNGKYTGLKNFINDLTTDTSVKNEIKKIKSSNAYKELDKDNKKTAFFIMKIIKKNQNSQNEEELIKILKKLRSKIEGKNNYQNILNKLRLNKNTIEKINKEFSIISNNTNNISQEVIFSFKPVYSNQQTKTVLSDIIDIYKGVFKREGFIPQFKGESATKSYSLQNKYHFDKNKISAQIGNNKISQNILEIINSYAKIGMIPSSPIGNLVFFISMILSFMKSDSVEYIFNECYPYYFYLFDINFANNYNFVSFMAKSIHSPSNKNMETFFSIISPTPFCSKIFENNLIQKIEQSNLPGILATTLQTIFFYSNYSNTIVRKYIENFGLSFLMFAIYLPDLLLYKHILDKKLKISSPFEDLKNGPIMLNYLMNLEQEYIKSEYNNIIIEYYFDYHQYVLDQLYLSGFTTQKEEINRIWSSSIVYGITKKEKIRKFISERIDEIYKNTNYSQNQINSLKNKLSLKNNVENIFNKINNIEKNPSLIENEKISQICQISPEKIIGNISKIIEKKYLFDPKYIDNNNCVINDIKKLFNKGYFAMTLSEIKNKVILDLGIKDSLNRSDRFIGRLQEYYNLFPDNYIDKIRDKFYEIMYIYQINKETALMTYSQEWFKSLLFILSLSQNIDVSLYIFIQIQPFISLFCENSILYNISFFQYLIHKKIINSDSEETMKISIFISPIASFSSQVFGVKPLINSYILKNREFINSAFNWISKTKNENNISIDTVKNMLKDEIYLKNLYYQKKNEIMKKIKTITYYTNYTNSKVKEYLKKYGTIFLYFSIYLPDITFYENNKKYIAELNFSNLPSNDFAISDLMNTSFNYFMSLTDEEILTKYQKIIDKYFIDYYNYVKGLDIYLPPDSNSFIEKIKKVRKNNHNNFNNNIDLVDANNIVRRILTTGIYY